MKQLLMDYITLIAAFFERIFSYFTLKVILASLFIVASFLFDPLRIDAMIAILVLIVIDFMTAIFACVKTCEDIKSRKVLYSAVKTAIYFLLIAAGFVAEKAIPLEIIDETIMAFLAATELISVLENASKAGFAVPQSLLKWLRDFSAKK